MEVELNEFDWGRRETYYAGRRVAEVDVGRDGLAAVFDMTTSQPLCHGAGLPLLTAQLKALEILGV